MRFLSSNRNFAGRILAWLLVAALILSACAKKPGETDETSEAGETDVAAEVSLTATGVEDLIDIDTITAQEVNYTLADCIVTDIVNTVSAQASVFVSRWEPVYFPESGAKIKDIYIFGETFIEKGQLLADAYFDEDILNASIEQAEIKFADSKKNFEQGVNNFIKEIDGLNRTLQERLSASPRPPESEIKILNLNILKKKSDYDYYVYATERKLSEQAEEIDRLKAMSNGLQIFAPYDGYAGNVIKTTSAGTLSDKNAKLMDITDLSNIAFRVTTDISNFRNNMDVKIVFPNEVTYDAKIVSDPRASETKETQVQFLAVPNTQAQFDRRLSTMRFISVEGIKLELKDVVAVPYQAVRNEGPDRYVLILEDGTVKKRYVVQGAYNMDYAQIIDGVTPGQKIILN